MSISFTFVEKSDLKCAICFDTPTFVCDIRCCGNIFCSRCVRSWVKTHRACPVCTTDAEDADVNASYYLRRRINRLEVSCDVCGKRGILEDIQLDHTPAECHEQVGNRRLVATYNGRVFHHQSPTPLSDVNDTETNSESLGFASPAACSQDFSVTPLLTYTSRLPPPSYEVAVSQSEHNFTTEVERPFPIQEEMSRASSAAGTCSAGDNVHYALTTVSSISFLFDSLQSIWSNLKTVFMVNRPTMQATYISAVAWHKDIVARDVQRIRECEAKARARASGINVAFDSPSETSTIPQCKCKCGSSCTPSRCHSWSTKHQEKFTNRIDKWMKKVEDKMLEAEIKLERMELGRTERQGKCIETRERFKEKREKWMRKMSTKTDVGEAKIECKLLQRHREQWCKPKLQIIDIHQL
eukprot:CFRG3428T1